MHEAAHIVVAASLNTWECSASALICADGRSGVAILPLGLTSRGEAIATAAGDHGMRLPIDAPKRRRAPRRGSLSTAEGIRNKAVTDNQNERAKTRTRSANKEGNDAERVAVYCISLRAEDPQHWVDTHRLVNDEARRLVYELRHEIKRHATTLFHKGAIELVGNPEHDELLNGAGTKQAH